MARRRRNPTGLPWGWILGIGGGAVAVGTGVYLATKSSSPAPTTATTPAPVAPAAPAIPATASTQAAAQAAGQQALQAAAMAAAQANAARAAQAAAAAAAANAPGPHTYAMTLTSSNLSAGLKVGDSLQVSPPALTAQMQTWKAQFCPNCSWVGTITNQNGVLTLNPGGSGSQAAVITLDKTVNPANTWLVTAVGQGAATIELDFEDPSGNPVGERLALNITVTA